jgi:hypothetical protein
MNPSDNSVTDQLMPKGWLRGPSRRFLFGAAAVGLVAPVIRPKPRRPVRPLTGDYLLTAAARPLALTLQAQQLTPLFAGLAGRLDARCNIVCIGDSITEGQHAEGPPSTGFENRWLARFRDLLRTRYPTQELTGGGRGFIGVASTGELSFTWPATTSQALGTGSGGPKAKFLQLGGTGQSITFHLAGDSADIMWMQVPFGGSFSWAVDGGIATKISTTAARSWTASSPMSRWARLARTRWCCPGCLDSRISTA